MFGSRCKTIRHIYGVHIYDFVQFGADPDNNPDLTEENALALVEVLCISESD